MADINKIDFRISSGLGVLLELLMGIDYNDEKLSRNQNCFRNEGALRA